jgi:hypothetical protein
VAKNFARLLDCLRPDPVVGRLNDLQKVSGFVKAARDANCATT